MWHVKDVILIFFECNAIYIEDVKDRSNTPKGCNAMYVKYVEDGKRTYTHIFVQGMWHVEGVRDVILIFSECNTIYVEDRSDTPKAVTQCMLKIGKEHTHTSLLITFLIFNRFSIRKKFWKAETKNFSTIHQILCILKHVKDVKDNLRHLRHASIYIGLESLKSQLSKTFFRLNVTPRCHPYIFPVQWMQWSRTLTVDLISLN